MAIVARILGTPTEIIPPQLSTTSGNYFQAQIEGETICVTPIARQWPSSTRHSPPLYG